MVLEKNISESDTQQRVDRYLRKWCPGLTLSRVHFLFRKKEIKINGKPVPRNHILQSGEKLSVYGLKEGEDTLRRQGAPSKKTKMDIPILYEDEHLLVLDKPAGLAVHPGTDVPEGFSVIEKAQGYLGTNPEELFKPSLVHRLDKDTSGVLLIAKSGKSLRHWTSDWREKKIEKWYFALVIGRPPKKQDTLVSNFSRIDSKEGGAKTVESKEGKLAETYYEIQEELGDYTLLKVRIKTGRLHQIRAHLLSLGLPILGDSRYGNFLVNRSAKLNIGLRRIFLHAAILKGRDGQGKEKAFEAGLPEDLKRSLTALREKKGHF